MGGEGSSKNIILNADSYFDLTRCVIENRVKMTQILLKIV